MICKLARQGDKAEWRNAGQGWEGVEQEWQLQGWTVARRVIVLRRKLDRPPQAEPDPAQPSLPGLMLEHKGGEQKEPFRIKAAPRWSKRAFLQLNWVPDELFVRGDIYESVIKPFGILSNPVIHHSSGKAFENIVQLMIDEEICVDLAGRRQTLSGNCKRTKAESQFDQPMETKRFRPYSISLKGGFRH